MVPPVPNPAQNPSIGVSISRKISCAVPVSCATEIIGVLELLRDVDLWVIFGQFVSERDAARDAFADIAFVVHHDDFRAVLPDELMAFV